MTRYKILWEDQGENDATGMSALIRTSPSLQITRGGTRQFHQIFTVWPLYGEMLII